MGAISIENWTHNIIRREAKENPEYQRYIGKGHLREVTKSDIRDFQLFKLRKLLDYVSQRSPFYRDIFRKEGIEPREISRLEDLSEIPFTEPKDLSQNSYRFLCVSLGEVARLYSFITSGTTGPPKKIFYTKEDLERASDFMEACIRTVSTPEDVVQIIFLRGRRLSLADLLTSGVKKAGAKPVLAPPSLSISEQIEIIKNFHTTILLGSAPRIYRITQEAKDQHDLGKMGIKAIIPTSEYLSEARRREMEKAWKCQTSAHYGLTEMGFAVAQECKRQEGFHLNEIHLLIEVVDPLTGEVLEEGEEGELVFTTLAHEGTPLIRYRTHDLSKLIPGNCNCGITTLRRLGPVKKRRESVVRIGEGNELYPTLFDDLLYSIPKVIDYQVILTQEGGKDSLSFKVEVTEKEKGLREKIKRVLLKAPLIQKNLKTHGITPPKIELVGRGTLRPLKRAKKLILDKREISL